MTTEYLLKESAAGYGADATRAPSAEEAIAFERPGPLATPIAAEAIVSGLYRFREIGRPPW